MVDDKLNIKIVSISTMTQNSIPRQLFLLYRRKKKSNDACFEINSFIKRPHYDYQNDWNVMTSENLCFWTKLKVIDWVCWLCIHRCLVVYDDIHLNLLLNVYASFGIGKHRAIRERMLLDKTSFPKIFSYNGYF